ncbi:MAG: DUF2130 domain-containing protein [Acholeplasma sp.]|nr:DUF2130 domain-containing protein [Acholeplasma sp.]
MKKIKVLVKDKTTLELEEDGAKGDLIDLNESLTIDQNVILEKIKKATDTIYNSLLYEEKSKFDLAKKNEILEVNKHFKDQINELKDLIKDKENEMEQLSLTLKAEKDTAISKIEKQELETYVQKEAVLKEEISNLKQSLEVLRTNQESNLENQKQKVELEFQAKLKEKDIELSTKANELALLINEHKNEIQRIKLELSGAHNKNLSSKETEIATLNEKLTNLQQRIKSEIERETLKVSQTLQTTIQQKDNEINVLKEKIDTKIAEHKLELTETENLLKEAIADKTRELEQIKREKSSRNVKTIGEELENWCNEQFKSVKLFGFKTSTWEKDNTPIKSANETKGTKGDYIFRVYNNDEQNIELVSAMCEMKSESLESENKKKNSDHFKKLDEDRNKKNLQYAILVSELEYNVETDAPIFVVPEYEKMYVVRPNYFITLLGIIESIGLKYSELITQKTLEKINFKDSQMILDEFEEFKENLLRNSIKNINKNLDDIKVKANKIIGEANEIIGFADIIINSHLNTVRNKIEGFSIRSLNKKIQKISKE